ncbi:MAG: hypothetical protein KJN84_09225, partial [Bacteroidia bacterium]|nr:hypothetical protein [Bacteroidia bacterium]
MDITKQDKNMKRVDKGWNKMHGLLDEKLPQKKKKNRFFFFLLLGLLPLMGYLYLKATDTSGFSQEDPVLVEKETDKVVDLDNITEDIDSKEIIKKDNQFDDVVTLQPNSKSDNQKTVTQQEINDAKKIISSRQQTDASDEKAKNDQRKQDNKSNQANSNSILKTNNTNYNFAEKINDKPLAGNNENNTSLLSTDIETNDINVIADTDLNTTVGIDLSESNSIAQLDKVALINFIPLQKISSSLPQNKLVLFEGFVPEPILVSNTTKNIIGFNLGLNALTDYISDLDIFGGSAGIFAELEINNKFGLGISGGYS